VCFVGNHSALRYLRVSSRARKTSGHGAQTGVTSDHNIFQRGGASQTTRGWFTGPITMHFRPVSSSHQEAPHECRAETLTRGLPRALSVTRRRLITAARPGRDARCMIFASASRWRPGMGALLKFWIARSAGQQSGMGVPPMIAPRTALHGRDARATFKPARTRNDPQLCDIGRDARATAIS
jgi:hypothetical protein